MKIPVSVIKNNLNVKDHEITYADGSIVPIVKLVPFMGYRWRIKAKVMKKGEIRSWKNERGEGYLMNVDIMDEEGTMIQTTFFKEMADKYNSFLKLGYIYLFSGGLVKESSPKYSSIKHEYCIVFDKQTEIKEIQDDGSINDDKIIPKFNFLTIPQI